MTFWQTKWRAMNGFRRMILAVLALMLAGFGAAIRQGDWGVFRLAVRLTRIC